MERPVHHDPAVLVAAWEKLAQQNFRDAARLAENDSDRRFVELQKRLWPAERAALTVMVEAVNEGSPRHLIAQALGSLCGNIIAGFAVNQGEVGPDAAASYMLVRTREGVMATLYGADGAVRREGSSHGIVGGST